MFDSTLFDLGTLTLCAVVGVYAAKILRLPADRLVGPLLATATIEVAGVTEAAPPYELHVARIAMIVIGAPIVFRAKRRLRAARGRNLPTKSNSSDE